MMAAPGHQPVMLREVLEALAPASGKTYVDGTFGGGGYARGLLEAAACRVYGIDRDPAAIGRAQALRAQFGERLILLPGRFGEMDLLLAAEGVNTVDGVTLDLGVSSYQLGEAARGFSFVADGPLDMRMGDSGPTAADLVNEASESELADAIYRFGEEPRSRAIARAIVAARQTAPIARTLQLAQIVARVAQGAPGRHPATRTFQALRIWVNDELGELERGLAAAERLLAPEGRLAVVAFHSLEDRIVKQFLARRSGRQSGASRHLPPTAPAVRAPSFRGLFSGVCKPASAEVAANPRARSARLRAAMRTAAPAWPARENAS